MKLTDEEKIKDIKSRFEQLKNNRDRFLDRWKEAQETTGSSVYDWENLEGIPSVPNRYSSAPCNYLKTLVNGLVGYSISPHIIWFKLSLENSKLLNEYGVKDWLEECEEVMNAEFNRSNLYQQANKFVEDSALIGHGTMYLGEDLKENKLRFNTMRPNEIYLDNTEDGVIDTVFRRFVMTLRNAVEFFGLENLPEKWQEDYKEINKWNQNLEILHAVYPRKEADKDGTSQGMQFASIYIDYSSNKILLESGYEELPYAIFEWNQIPGFAYSESVVAGAITDIRALNVMEKSRLEIAQTSARPPLRISDSLRNITLVPSGHNYVKKDEIIEPIRTGENYPITLDVVKQKQQDVKDWFNVDFFLMLQQKQQQMTATEVLELQGEKAAVLSSLIVNLNAALTKIISRSFNLLFKQGKLPELPLGLENQQTGMKIDFMGPLAQAQKKYHTMGGISQALQLATGIIQVFPGSGDFIDGDQLMKRALEGQGMPQAIIKEDKDVQELREKRAQAQQEAQAQQQQQEMAAQLMSNANKLNEPIRQGSVMQALNDQMAGAYQ